MDVVELVGLLAIAVVMIWAVVKTGRAAREEGRGVLRWVAMSVLSPIPAVLVFAMVWGTPGPGMLDAIATYAVVLVPPWAVYGFVRLLGEPGPPVESDGPYDGSGRHY